MDLETFRQQVSDELNRRYGLTWADACGDREPLERALADGEEPPEFVERFGQKYDLTPVSNARDW
jgi:hypothetical protein